MSEPKSVTTEDGRVFTRRPGKLTVRHMVEAERQAGKAQGLTFGMALISQMLLVNGQAAILEDLMDLSLESLDAVQSELLDDIEAVANFKTGQPTL